MWLRTGRRRWRDRTVAVLLAVVVFGGTFGWGHTGGDDPDCDIVIVEHDHSAHRLSSAPAHPSSSGDHCYICHSLRLLHNVVASRYERVAVVFRTVSRLDGDLCVRRDGLFASLPSRAPPAIHL